MRGGKNKFQDLKVEIHNTHISKYWQYLTSDLVFNLMAKRDKKRAATNGKAPESELAPENRL